MEPQIANLTTIPSNRVPFIDDRTGLMTREWFIFFQHLNTLVGGGSNVTSMVDLQLAPNAINSPEDVDVADTSVLQGYQTQLIVEKDDLTPVYQQMMVVDDLSPPSVVGTLSSQNADNVTITGGTIKLNGGATLIGTNAALTNGAGVAAGTLLTAPTAGNPTKWIGINDNGTTRYVPSW